MQPNAIRQAREQAGLTQTKAANLLSVTLRTWQRWEAGDTEMPSYAWELFLRKLEEL